MKPQNYKGYQITYEYGLYWSEGKTFDTLTKAKDQVDIWVDADELLGISYELEMNN